MKIQKKKIVTEMLYIHRQGLWPLRGRPVHQLGRALHYAIP
jgi:hypothetical protein